MHHRWPACLVFSPPPRPRIMPSGGPSSSCAAFLFCKHVCPSNGSVCLGQWQPDKESAHHPTRMLNRGARGPCHRRNNGAGRGRAWHPRTEGEVKPGWPWGHVPAWRVLLVSTQQKLEPEIKHVRVLLKFQDSNLTFYLELNYPSKFPFQDWNVIEVSRVDQFTEHCSWYTSTYTAHF